MSKLVCSTCGHTYEGCEDCNDDRCHDDEAAKIECPEGHGVMVWKVEPEMERKVGVTFDYTFQVYRDKDGNAVKSEDNWDFPCNKCYAPAAMTGMNAHYEYYTCLNCNHEVRVN